MVETPVVVHAACDVTRHHVEESRGGLYFSSAEDLAGVTNYFLKDPERRISHARAGASYVRERYSWTAVLSRFDNVVEALLAESHKPSRETESRS